MSSCVIKPWNYELVNKYAVFFSFRSVIVQTTTERGALISTKNLGNDLSLETLCSECENNPTPFAKASGFP